MGRKGGPAQALELAYPTENEPWLCRVLSRCPCLPEEGKAMGILQGLATTRSGLQAGRQAVRHCTAGREHNPLQSKARSRTSTKPGPIPDAE